LTSNKEQKRETNKKRERQRHKHQEQLSRGSVKGFAAGNSFSGADLPRIKMYTAERGAIVTTGRWGALVLCRRKSSLTNGRSGGIYSPPEWSGINVRLVRKQLPLPFRFLRFILFPPASCVGAGHCAALCGRFIK
jgi:hypothetical protein